MLTTYLQDNDAGDKTALVAEAERACCDHIGSSAPGTTVTLRARVRAVTIPGAGEHHYNVTIDDGTGTATLRFLGRRHINGIDPGTVLGVTGRVCVIDGATIIFNPAITLHN